MNKTEVKSDMIRRLDAQIKEVENGTLVLHFNAFTGKLVGGYRMHGGVKVGAMMHRVDVLAYLAQYPDVRCEPLKV